MLNVTLYYLPGDERCLQVEKSLLEVNKTIPHNLVKINILEDESSQKIYSQDAPVILVGPYQLKGSYTDQDIRIALMAAENRAGICRKKNQVSIKTGWRGEENYLVLTVFHCGLRKNICWFLTCLFFYISRCHF